MNGDFDESDRAAVRRLEAQLAEQDARGLRLAEEVERLEAELARLSEEAKKDYDDMRRFQARFIEANQRLRRIEEAARAIDGRLHAALAIESTEEEVPQQTGT